MKQEGEARSNKLFNRAVSGILLALPLQSGFVNGSLARQ